MDSDLNSFHAKLPQHTLYHLMPYFNVAHLLKTECMDPPNMGGKEVVLILLMYHVRLPFEQDCTDGTPSLEKLLIKHRDIE